MPDAPFPYAGEVAALVSSLLWAISGILFFRARLHVGASAMNTAKNLTGVICFALFLLATTGSPWPAALASPGFWLLVASGVAGLTLCDSLLFRSILEIGPRRANLFMALAPVIAALVVLLPPISERVPPPLAWLGMAACLTGVVVAILERSPDPVRKQALRRGARNALIAACLQGVALVLARAGLPAAGATTAGGSMVRLAAGTTGLFLIGGLSGRTGAWARQLRTEHAWRIVVVAAFLGTFLGIWTNQAGLAWAEHTGVAATLNGLAPVWLIPLSTLFLGEGHDRRTWASTLLAVGGIALMVLSG